MKKYPYPKYEVNRLIISDIVRIVLTVAVLYYTKIPIFWKIIIIMVADKLDCTHLHSPRFGPLLSSNINICKTPLYQQADKITDTICYILILHYVIHHGGLSPIYNKILIGLLVYRIIGTILYLVTNNRLYLVYFPNLFLEICLALMVIKHYPKLEKYKTEIFIGVVIIKMITEYYLHIFKAPPS